MTWVEYFGVAGVVAQVASIVYLQLVAARLNRLYRRDMQQYRLDGMQIERGRWHALHGREFPFDEGGVPADLPPGAVVH